MFELTQVFSESCGHQSLCSIHVIKPTHPNFEHTKYEPDISSHARKKWGVKITGDFRTPCSFSDSRWRKWNSWNSHDMIMVYSGGKSWHHGYIRGRGLSHGIYLSRSSADMLCSKGHLLLRALNCQARLSTSGPQTCARHWNKGFQALRQDVWYSNHLQVGLGLNSKLSLHGFPR